MFDKLSEKITDAFKNISGKGKISENNIEDALKDIRTALLEADVNFKVVKNLINQVKEKSIGEKVIKGVNPGEQFVKIVHDELKEVMGGECKELDFKKSESGINTIVVVGLNGAGKTTFSAKLALFIRKKYKKNNILIVPADTFRPAAKDQLKILAKNIDIDCYDSDLTLKPKDLVLRAMEDAKKQGKDVVIIDTAGRLHVDQELMGELKDLKSSVENFNPAMSPEVLLVADAMTGQEAVNVSETFHKEIGLTGVVLSKMDSDARGGAALSIKAVTGVPIRFISVGEKLKDLELFHPDRLSQRILDMGDIVSLVEKAQDIIDENEAQKMMERAEKNRFTIDDFLTHMNSINKLGSMTSIMKMIPGMGGLLRQAGDLSPAEDELKKMKIIISSMTKEERLNEKIINNSRIKRIATGSGTTIDDINQFLQKFAQMKKMMSQVMGMMKGGMLGNMLGGMGGLGGLGGLGGAGGDLGDMMGNQPMKGFRQNPGASGKMKKKGKRRGPWGGGYF
ncbi:MAG: signal recognition particle protein [Oligoflexia bacterium]|nr:signal recognition particle protein [Oligoflexia bacterium]